MFLHSNKRPPPKACTHVVSLLLLFYGVVNLLRELITERAIHAIVADHFPDCVLFVSSATIICQITIIPIDSENVYWLFPTVKIST